MYFDFDSSQIYFKKVYLIVKGTPKEFDYQFVWSVVSAFPKGADPFTTEIPYADGNPKFWEGAPEKQLKNSLFEIVCWDSSATLFIGLSNELSNKLLSNAPGIKDLNKLNEHRKC